MNKQCLAAISVILAALTSPLHAHQDKPADTLVQWMSVRAPFDFILIDVRDSIQVDSVIADDSCRPYNLSLNYGILQQFMSVIPRDSVVVVYCQSGNRSNKAADTLDAHGFTRVYDLGGINSWTGSKRWRSAIKPVSALPEPSKHATSAQTVILPAQVGASVPVGGGGVALLVGLPSRAGWQPEGPVMDIRGRTILPVSGVASGIAIVPPR